jgi:predicted CXXCH cytochrome family protein
MTRSRRHHVGSAVPNISPGSRSALGTVEPTLLILMAIVFLAGCEQKAIVVNATNPPTTLPSPFEPPPATQPLMIGSIHPPFEKNECEPCHADKRSMDKSAFDARTCISCHEKLMIEWKYMHGPVVTRECLACHTAHESSAPDLLVHGDQRVCTNCHPLKSLSLRATAHRNKRKNCLDCHYGHGGRDFAMLKPGTAPWRKTAATQASK